MGGGNGAKAAQKRERALKDAKGGAVSQLKVNEKAMNKKCATCMQPFLQTANKKVRHVLCCCFRGWDFTFVGALHGGGRVPWVWAGMGRARAGVEGVGCCDC